jgi:lysophospholipase L1-like esterase
LANVAILFIRNQQRDPMHLPRLFHALLCGLVMCLCITANAEVRVLTYGDSNTWGFKPSVEGDFLPRYSDAQRWSGVMQKKLGSGYVVSVVGVPGRSLNYDLPADLDSISKEDGNGLRRLALSLTEDAPVNLLIVMLGTNDLIHKPRPTPDEIASGLVQVKKLAEANTLAYSPSQKQRLLVVVPAPLRDTRRGPFGDDFDDQAISESRELAKAFMDEGERLGIPVFDAGSVVDAEGIDGVHLSEAGHRRLGEAIAKKVKDLVRL